MNGHIPRKRFGQHFLHDKRVIERIIDSLNIDADDHWVEIGPGQAALTDHLIHKSNQLRLIEIDHDLTTQLKIRFEDHHNIDIINQDVLKVDFNELVTKDERLRLVGNLPYNISTSIFFQLAKFVDVISDMTFMVQKEVADRLMASPNTKTYGRLTLSVGLRFEVQRLFDVGKGAFNPPPKVESSVIRMTPHTQQVESNLAVKFDELVKSAFLKRRKTLRNSLNALVNQQNFEQTAIDPGLRAETLTINDFLKLAQQVL